MSSRPTPRHAPSRAWFHRLLLLFAALCWAALPVSLYAGPGGGGHGGGGGGGGHAGGGGGYSGGGGGHVGGGGGHVTSSGHTGYGSRVTGSSGGAAPAAHANGGVRPNYAGSAGLTSFAAVGDANHGHASAGADPNLRMMAGGGWSFLPSSGVSARPSSSVHTPARPSPLVHPMSIPAIHPIRPLFFHHRPFFGNGFIFPFGGIGGCFFNGFTSICGANAFFFGGFGPNYCFSNFGFWNCGLGGYGFGPGYDIGYGPGYGYGPGPASGSDVNGYAGPGAYDNQPNTGNMDVYAGPLPEMGEAEAQNPPATPQEPLPQLIFKNGTAFEVTAYWVANGELYYRPVTGGLSHVPADQLDLAATVEANSRNGITFQLTVRPPQ